jgi:CheY-like chemotaxis protein
MTELNVMTVLIVDDHETMCRSIQKMMNVSGYGKKFFYANNGEEALAILHSKPIELILLDYNMPGMTGAEVLSHIRDDRELRDLPVLMVTGQAYGDYVAEAAESEIDAYLLKPLSIKLLEEKISIVVQNANNPPPMVQHLKVAKNLDENGDIDGAIKETEQAVKEDPGSSRPIRDLGYYYLKNNDLKNAEKWLLKAVKLNDLDVFAFHHLGELYLKLKKIQKAQHYFEKAMRISPRHLSRGIQFGKTLVQMKMTKRAITVFDEALSLTGSTPELWEEITDFCIEAGVNGYATKLLESILREQPHRKDLFFKLGKALEASGDSNKAVNYLVKAAQVDKKNDQIKIHLAKNYLNLKKPVWADKALKQVLKVNPDHEEARELLKKCLRSAG